MSYRWILFDADGTLFDYDLAESEALERLWAAAGLEPRSDLVDVYRRINGALWKRLETGETTADRVKVERFRDLVDELGVDADPSRLSSDYLVLLAEQTHLLPGAERLLESLAETHRMALITNGLAEVQRPRLERSSIGRHFEVVVISEEVGYAKPDGRIFDRALAMMGSPPKGDVLMVGDNLLADIEGARRFGLATCWLNLDGRAANGEVEPTYEIGKLDQLRHLLASAASTTSTPCSTTQPLPAPPSSDAR